MVYIKGLFNANLSMRVKIRRSRIKIWCIPLLFSFFAINSIIIEKKQNHTIQKYFELSLY